MTRPDAARSFSSSSIVITGIRRMLRGSVLLAPLVTAASPGGTAARWEKFVRDRLAPDLGHDVDATALIAATAPVRWLTGRLQQIAAGWQDSTASRLLTPMAADLRQLPAPHRVSLVGWAAIVAAVVYRSLVGFRDPLVSRGSIAAWLAVIGVGGLLMALARPLAAAWQAKFSKPIDAEVHR